MPISGLKITKIPSGAYQANCYIVHASSGDAVIIDAPGSAADILPALSGLRAALIVLTHTHFDHTDSLSALRSALEVPIAVHSSEAGSLKQPPDRTLAHGDSIALGSEKLAVLHTPGHTPGSICLHWRGHLVSGDTLFPGGPGKTGSPADLDRILDSIRTRLLPLPDATAVHPGHGVDTALGAERAAIESFLSTPHPGLFGDVTWK